MQMSSCKGALRAQGPVCVYLSVRSSPAPHPLRRQPKPFHLPPSPPWPPPGSTLMSLIAQAGTWVVRLQSTHANHAARWGCGDAAQRRAPPSCLRTSHPARVASCEQRLARLRTARDSLLGFTFSRPPPSSLPACTFLWLARP
jgi:hypothetical protein